MIWFNKAKTYWTSQDVAGLEPRVQQESDKVTWEVIGTATNEVVAKGESTNILDAINTVSSFINNELLHIKLAEIKDGIKGQASNSSGETSAPEISCKV